MNFRCAVALLLFLPVGAGHCADAYVETRIQHYAISGQSADELRTAIIEASRSLGGGRHGAASASFKFAPELSYQMVGKSCFLADVKVRLVATITLPEWASAKGADENTSAAWRRFARYLEAHEARHAAIAAGFRKTMLDALEAIGVMADCTMLGREAVAVVADVERQHDEAQNAFDRQEKERSSLFGR